MSDTFELGITPPLGAVPKKMKAVVIRPDREGEPMESMKVEEIPVPECGPGDVLVLVMAAGINFNGVWAGRGKPVSVMKMHPDEPFHVAGSDASGIVWKVGNAVITVLGCQGTNPEQATELADWKFYLEQRGKSYPGREELEAIAREQGVLP